MWFIEQISLGSLWRALLEKGDLMVIVEVLELITDVSAHSAKYRPSDAYDVWFAADIMQCVAWYTLEDGLTTVIRL